MIAMLLSWCSNMRNVELTMTHNNDIAYASWDFNSLAIILRFFNSSLRQTWKKTSSRPFVRGIHRRWNRCTLDHQSCTPVIPCNGNRLVTSAFTARRASDVIKYGMTNYQTVTIWVSWVFDSFAPPRFVTGNILYYRCELAAHTSSIKYIMPLFERVCLSHLLMQVTKWIFAINVISCIHEIISYSVWSIQF